MFPVLMSRVAHAGRALVALVALALPAAAHDWWLEPLVRDAEIGTKVEVAANVGIAWQGERVRRDPRRIQRFVAHDALGEREVAGEPGADPLGVIALRAAGTTVIAFQSEAARVFLRAPDFESYLREEGLDAIIELRAERGHAERVGLEQYFRCAKALVRTPAAELRDRAVGLPLELVASGDLAALAAGGSLAVELHWRDAPLAAARVVAIERDHPTSPIVARTDAAGKAEFVLPRGGHWLVKAVHMVEAPAATRLDWESWWASLTFDTGSGGSAIAPPASATPREPDEQRG